MGSNLLPIAVKKVVSCIPHVSVRFLPPWLWPFAQILWHRKELPCGMLERLPAPSGNLSPESVMGKIKAGENGLVSSERI